MKILLATDGSEGAETALALLLDLPLSDRDPVTVLSVPTHSVGAAADMSGSMVAELYEIETGYASDAAERARARLAARGVLATARLDEGPAAQTIVKVAEEVDAGLIVIGSRGLGGIAGALLGSTARALARHSVRPVLVVKERREAPRRILVAVDGSPDALAAIEALASLPLPPDATVTLLHVAPDRAVPVIRGGLDGAIAAEDERAATRTLEQAATLLEGRRIGASVSVRGRPAQRILEQAAATGADLVVLGSRGTSLGRGFLQGSVADDVLAGAHCAVLVANRRLVEEEGRRADPELVGTGR